MTITTSFAQEELEELDRLRRDQGNSRAEAIRSAVRWYVHWADRLPSEDPTAEEIEA
jgi:metal-responsive CopG/Arc/MetJ family transcriptional regulator